MLTKCLVPGLAVWARPSQCRVRGPCPTEEVVWGGGAGVRPPARQRASASDCPNFCNGLSIRASAKENRHSDLFYMATGTSLQPRFTQGQGQGAQNPDMNSEETNPPLFASRGMDLLDMSLLLCVPASSSLQVSPPNQSRSRPTSSRPFPGQVHGMQAAIWSHPRCCMRLRSGDSSRTKNPVSPARSSP